MPQLNPRFRGHLGQGVIDDVVSERTEVRPRYATGAPFPVATIDDVVANPAALVRPILPETRDRLLPGKRRVVRVIYDDINRELGYGRVTEEERRSWLPPSIDDPVVEEITGLVGVTVDTVDTGSEHPVTNLLIHAVNDVLHRFVPLAYEACGYSRRRGQFHSHMGCSFTQQVKNVYSIISGFGLTPTKAWANEDDRNTA